MTEEIRAHLKELEQAREIEILLAVESGSRAWGFPSPDSDYDIRIIYGRKEEWYLDIGKKKDTIDYFHGELIDISGWDIRKALSLLSKSNATPAEWCQSPIVYHEREGFREQLFAFVQAYFNPVHTINHYRAIANNSYKSLSIDSSIKLKKLFYVIRPILAAKWIASFKTVPPMELQQLLAVVDDDHLATHINQLIEDKSTVGEDHVHQVTPLMQEYLSNLFEEMKQVNLEFHAKVDREPLNEFFRSVIRSI